MRPASRCAAAGKRVPSWIARCIHACFPWRFGRSVCPACCDQTRPRPSVRLELEPFDPRESPTSLLFSSSLTASLLAMHRLFHPHPRSRKPKHHSFRFPLPPKPAPCVGPVLCAGLPTPHPPTSAIGVRQLTTTASQLRVAPPAHQEGSGTPAVLPRISSATTSPSIPRRGPSHIRAARSRAAHSKTLTCILRAATVEGPPAAVAGRPRAAPARSSAPAAWAKESRRAPWADWPAAEPVALRTRQGPPSLTLPALKVAPPACQQTSS